MKNLRELSDSDLKFAIWARQQDNLHRGDILDRCQDPKHRALVQKNYDETEAEIRELFAELRCRTGGK